MERSFISLSSTTQWPCCCSDSPRQKLRDKRHEEQELQPEPRTVARAAKRMRQFQTIVLYLMTYDNKLKLVLQKWSNETILQTIVITIRHDAVNWDMTRGRHQLSNAGTEAEGEMSWDVDLNFDVTWSSEKYFTGYIKLGRYKTQSGVKTQVFRYL